MKLLILLVVVAAATATSISGTEDDAVDRVMRAVSEHCAAVRRKRAAMDSEDKVRNLILSAVKDCLEQEYMPGPGPDTGPDTGPYPWPETGPHDTGPDTGPFYVNAGKAGPNGHTVTKRNVEEVMAAVAEHCAESRRKRAVSPSSEYKVRKIVTDAIGRCMNYKPKSTTYPPMGSCQDCQDCYNKGYRAPGIYAITPSCGLGTFEVWCDFMGYKGWTVLQRRYDGSLDFTRDWTDYKYGFGTPNGEHWIGNDKIHCLTAKQENFVLNIEIEDPSTSPPIANGTWPMFSVADENDYYRLTVSDDGYVGFLDSSRLTYSNGMYFSSASYDNDNDSGNCAATHLAAWWYDACQYVHLTGVYGGKDLYRGFRYYTYSEQLRASVMRVTTRN